MVSVKDSPEEKTMQWARTVLPALLRNEGSAMKALEKISRRAGVGGFSGGRALNDQEFTALNSLLKPLADQERQAQTPQAEVPETESATTEVKIDDTVGKARLGTNGGQRPDRK